jgi:hypothetical protein
MENENTIPEEQYLTKKIRIYPNQKQKYLFDKCINGTRYFFNKANEYIINIKETEEKFKLPSIIDLRSKILINDSKLSEKDL